MRKDDRRNGGGDRKLARDIAFLVAGVGMGSVIALLLAPDTGAELRHNIGRSYRKTSKSIGRHTDGLRDRAEEVLEHAHDLREFGSRLLHFGRTHGAA